MEDDLGKALAEMEPHLGLPSGFIARLLRDDDWSFVIKTHALLESTLTFVLAKLFRHDEIRDALAQIEMNHNFNLLSALDVFSSDDRGALRELSKLRNDLVHNVEQVTFTFTDYLKNADVRKNFVRKFGFGWKETVEIGGKTLTREQMTSDNPKLTMWLVFAYLIGYAHLEVAHVELDKQKADLDAQKLKQLDTMFQRLSELAAQALAAK